MTVTVPAELRGVFLRYPNNLLLESRACRPTPLSHCHSLRARRSAASASHHRGACRASRDSRSTLHRPPSRLNRGAQAFR